MVTGLSGGNGASAAKHVTKVDTRGNEFAPTLLLKMAERVARVKILKAGRVYYESAMQVIFSALSNLYLNSTIFTAVSGDLMRLMGCLGPGP